MNYAYVSLAAVIFRRNGWTDRRKEMLDTLCSRHGAVWSYCDGVLKGDYDQKCVLNEPTGRDYAPKGY